MRHSLVLLCFATACFISRVSWSQGCEPTVPTRAVLGQLEVPDDAHLPAAQRRDLKLELLRKALSAAPADIALHEAYQKVFLGGMEVNRPNLIREYEQLPARNPGDPILLYLVANAQTGRKTKEAIANLERAIELAPDFGLPHLLLAQIYSARAYEDVASANRELERFVELCPASVRTLTTLKWGRDKELIAREARRLRKNIEARTDSEAVSAYPMLWSFEAALERSDHQSENQVRMRTDVERLFSPNFARNSAWLATIQEARIYDGVLEGVGRKAQQELAALYPNSDAALHEEYEKAVGDAKYPDTGTPEQITAYWRARWHSTLPLVRKWPATEWLAGTAATAVIADRSATLEEVAAVMAFYENAVQQDPGLPTSPPEPIWLAHELVDRGGPIDGIPDLVHLGLAAIERVQGANAVNDVSGRTDARLAAMWYILGYVPLAEAYVRLGRLSDADDALLQAEAKLQIIRPAENASSADKSRFVDMAAPYWFVRGLCAEKEGRKVDALIDYRNALALYPPRRPRPDRRAEVMASAQRVWKDLGGTVQGWTDWAAESSLAGFYSGSGGSEAWSKFAASSPDLILTDALGNRWNPLDLARKTTFITMWASWCGPCRAELPYVEKLYQRFRNRSDVAILAFNVTTIPRR